MSAANSCGSSRGTRFSTSRRPCRTAQPGSRSVRFSLISGRHSQVTPSYPMASGWSTSRQATTSHSSRRHRTGPRPGCWRRQSVPARRNASTFTSSTRQPIFALQTGAPGSPCTGPNTAPRRCSNSFPARCPSTSTRSIRRMSRTRAVSPRPPRWPRYP